VITSSNNLQSSSEDKILAISSGLDKVHPIIITISRIEHHPDILLKIWKVFGTRIPAMMSEKAISRLNDCKVGNTLRSKSAGNSGLRPLSITRVERSSSIRNRYIIDRYSRRSNSQQSFNLILCNAVALFRTSNSPGGAGSTKRFESSICRSLARIEGLSSKSGSRSC
jgi:hypothetical protein